MPTTLLGQQIMYRNELYHWNSRFFLHISLCQRLFLWRFQLFSIFYSFILTRRHSPSNAAAANAFNAPPSWQTTGSGWDSALQHPVQPLESHMGSEVHRGALYMTGSSPPASDVRWTVSHPMSVCRTTPLSAIDPPGLKALGLTMKSWHFLGFLVYLSHWNT